MVEPQKIDPVQELGIRPKAPLSLWGWGSIPDQYGRRWADDVGEGEVPTRPRDPAPMRSVEWPPPQQLPELDLGEVRAAVQKSDVSGFLSAIIGREINDSLQQLGTGIRLALKRGLTGSTLKKAGGIWLPSPTTSAPLI